MSWLDEGLAREAARAVRGDTPAEPTDATDRDTRAETQVRALDALIQQLLGDYGERILGRNYRGRLYGLRLESPGQKSGARRGEMERWDWHWHLHSYARGVPGLEVHPEFDATGGIVALVVRGGRWSERCAPDEDAFKATLLHAYTALHSNHEK